MNPTPTITSMRARAHRLYHELGPRVDAQTALALRRARTRALDPERARPPGRWMVPTSAMALALLAAVALWQPLQHPLSSNTPAAEASAVLPPDASQADPAMYQDLGFYAWLAGQSGTEPHGSY